MERTITINGKLYPAKEVTFNTVCQFEDMGIQMSEIDKKSVMLVRAYAAVCMNCDSDKAGNEIEQHIIGGGTLEEIAGAMNKAIEDSGFFQALSKRAKETDSEGKAEAE